MPVLETGLELLGWHFVISVVSCQNSVRFLRGGRGCPGLLVLARWFKETY